MRSLLAHHCVATALNLVRYVCETMANRVLRFVQKPAGVYHFSVFYQVRGGGRRAAAAAAAADDDDDNTTAAAAAADDDDDSDH